MQTEAHRPLLTQAMFEDQRRTLRIPVSASLRGVAVDRMPATITDISCDGCQVRFASYLAPNTYVVLTIPSFAPLGATVVWTDGDAIGLQFAEPLHAAIVDHIARVYHN